MNQVVKLYATASAGTEDLFAEELRALGIPSIRPGRGVVAFDGTLRDALNACLHLRTAMRVLLPVGSVPAPDADTMYEGVRALDWSEHLNLRSTFAVEISGRNERLGHSHYAALNPSYSPMAALGPHRSPAPDSIPA